MNNHPVHQLHNFFFDRLDTKARASVELHIAACASCKRRLEAFEQALTKVPSLTPGQGLRERLFHSLDHLERFAPFAQRLGEIIALPANEARRALHAFADVDSWSLEPLPGMRAFPLFLDPVHSPVRAIFACFDPSSRVPLHRHLDRESVFVLQGAFETTEGRVVRAGEELISEPGSVHGIVRFSDDIACLCVITNPDRIEFVESPLAAEAP